MKRYLPLLAALALGALVGFVAGSAGRGPGARAQRETPDVQRDDARIDLPPAGRSSLGDALRALPVPEAEQGSGRITGRVTEPGGRPVVGVLVRAWRRAEGSASGPRWRHGDGPPPEPGLEERVRRIVEDYHRTRGTRAEATTDADGSYVLTGITADPYRIGAWARGYQVRRNGRGPVHAGEVVDFLARPLVDVPVDVRQPDGTQPERAQVSFRSDKGGRTFRWTPAQPDVRIGPGNWKIRAEIRDEELRSEAVVRAVLRGEAVEPVVLRLAGRPGLFGEVRITGIADLSDLYARCLRFGGDEPPPDADLLQHGQRDSLNRDAGYRFRDLEPGRYAVGLALGRGLLLARRVVEVADHAARCDFELDGVDPAGVAVVRVLGPDEKPVEDVRFRTEYRSGRSLSSGGGPALRRDDGAYLVPHHPHDSGKGGTYVIVGRSGEYGARRIEYERRERTTLEMRFGPPARLAATIDGFLKSPLQARLRLALDSRKAGRAKAEPDGEGRAVLGPVQPGGYDLVLALDSGRIREHPIARTPVTLGPGDNEARIAIPPLYELTIEDCDVAGNVQLRREGADSARMPRWKRPDAAGKIVFAGLPAGRYQLSAGGSVMVVDVAKSRTVRWAPAEVRAIRVSVTDPQGWYAQAGFQDGDLVVGIDGDDFRNKRHLYAVWAGVWAKDRTVFHIRRDNRRVDLELDGQEFEKHYREGGHMEFTAR